MYTARALLTRLVGAVVGAALIPGCTLPVEGNDSTFDEEVASAQEPLAMTMLGADVSSVAAHPRPRRKRTTTRPASRRTRSTS